MQTQGKILAVDDDPNNIAILEELLDDNYDLRISSNGEQALGIAREFLPDIILLDIMMPGMDGYQVCQKLREHDMLKDTKVIMLSARALNSEQLEGYRVGADDYITKPFDGDEFLEKVRMHFRSRNIDEADRLKGDVTSTTL
jgi:two-component system sensor histidine kinase/response regulator